MGAVFNSFRFTSNSGDVYHDLYVVKARRGAGYDSTKHRIAPHSGVCFDRGRDNVMSLCRAGSACTGERRAVSRSGAAAQHSARLARSGGGKGADGIAFASRG